MSDFEKRSAELAARFETMRPGLAEADATRVAAALKRHADLRSGCMTLLCEVVANTETTEKAGTINDLVDQTKTDVVAVLNGLLDGIDKPSDDLRSFRDIAASEESKFFDGLKKLNCGATRDEMLRYLRELADKTVVLRGKWLKMGEDEQTLLRKERLYAGQMRELLTKIYEVEVPAHYTAVRTGTAALAVIPNKAREIVDSLTEKWQEAEEQAGRNPENAKMIMETAETLGKKAVFDYLDSVVPHLGKLVDYSSKALPHVAELAQGTVDEQVKEVKASLGCGRRVIVTFSKTRREAADFVRENGYNKAKPYCENARKELDDFVSAQPSSSGAAAFRDEAESFADRAERSWMHFLGLMRTQHEGFVNEFNGIFVDQVSEATINTLTDLPEIKAFADKITGMDLDVQLNALYDNTVDLHGDLELAFGSLNIFLELPYTSQATIQAKIREIQEQVGQPLTAAMQEQLRKLDAARQKKTKSLAEEIEKEAREMALEAISEAGAPSSLG